MRNPYDDKARALLLDDITPIDGIARQPRGCARRGSVVVLLDAVSGEFVGSNKPTPDPPDFVCKRVPKWAGMYSTVKEDK